MNNRVGIIGAASLIGHCLLAELVHARFQPIAFTRQKIEAKNPSVVKWQQLTESMITADSTLIVERSIPSWICAAPIWVLPSYFALLENSEVQKIVVLSSTSRFTKMQSSQSSEQQLADCLANAEIQVQRWAEQRQIEWVILRPTLIYGFGQDRNITEIIRFVRKFKFFPLLGQASGLRQPVHAEDVAIACIASLRNNEISNNAFNISGGETLTYRDMVMRIFNALGQAPHLLTIPLWLFHLAVALLRLIPRYRHWTVAMAERMNQDLVFDHSDAAQKLGFAPRAFILNKQDLS